MKPCKYTATDRLNDIRIVLHVVFSDQVLLCFTIIIFFIKVHPIFNEVFKYNLRKSTSITFFLKKKSITFLQKQLSPDPQFQKYL